MFLFEFVGVVPPNQETAVSRSLINKMFAEADLCGKWTEHTWPSAFLHIVYVEVTAGLEYAINNYLFCSVMGGTGRKNRTPKLKEPSFSSAANSLEENTFCDERITRPVVFAAFLIKA